jgi:hypothetical protein
MGKFRKLLLVTLVGTGLGCGGAEPAGCQEETDAELCAQQALVCGSTIATDRCGAPRDVTCGACDGTCHGTFCRCETASFAGSQGAIDGVTVLGRQHVLLGTTPSASTILLLRSAIASCSSDRMWLYDGNFISGVYDGVEIHDLFAGFTPAVSLDEEQVTLTPDGLTVVATLADRSGFVASSRSGVGNVDFATPTDGWFVQVNDPVAVHGSPTISNDGLSLFFVRGGVLMEARRPHGGAPFGTASALPGAASGQINDGTFWEVTGATADRLTLFVSKNYTTHVFVRDSLDATPVSLSTAGAIGGIWRAQPLDRCGLLLGTLGSGGCLNERIGWVDASP